MLAAVRRAGDDPSAADRAALALVRRRFGLSLPPPFVPVPPPGGPPPPVRPAEPPDGAAIAAVKLRAWRRAYRGILPDAFLDDLAVVPAPGYWVQRATAATPAADGHGCCVAGSRGVVLGMVDIVLARDEDVDATRTVEVRMLYVDPSAQGRGLGRALLDAATGHAIEAGSEGLVLWVAEANAAARAFYEAAGWRPDGAGKRFEVTPEVAMDEVRYRLGPVAPP